MKERFKLIRKSKKITQQAFANSLGLSQNFIAQIEMGTKTPSERTIKDICREFHVNETWLRTGEGEMFDKSLSDELAGVLDKYNMSDGARMMVEKFVVLDPEAQDIILEYCLSVAEGLREATPDQSSDPGRMAAGTEEMSVEEAEAIYKSSLSDARKQDAGVLNTTGDAGERPA